MKILLTLMIILLMISLLQAQFSKWRKVYIFGAAENPQMAEQQIHLFDSAKHGIDERQIKVIQVPPGDALEARFNIKKTAFTIILIGKDGGEKYRTQKLLLPEKLFGIIDAMPMRRAEMNGEN